MRDGTALCGAYESFCGCQSHARVTQAAESHGAKDNQSKTKPAPFNSFNLMQGEAGRAGAHAEGFAVPGGLDRPLYIRGSNLRI